MKKHKLRVIEKAMPAVDNECYARLIELARRAKRGEIQGFAAMAIASSNTGQVDTVSSCYGGEGIRRNVHAVIGGIENLKLRFIKDFDL